MQDNRLVAMRRLGIFFRMELGGHPQQPYAMFAAEPDSVLRR